MLGIINKYFHKKFDSNVWKRSPELRRYYILDVLQSVRYLGATKPQIEEAFGFNESVHGKFSSRWIYFVKIKINRKYFLVFYFENDLVIDIRYEYEFIV